MSNKNSIFIYNKPNFEGTSIKLNVGVYFSDKLGIENNAISSIKLGPRTTAKFYNTSRGIGNYLKLSNNSLTEIKEYPTLPFKWNNTISSIRIYEYGKEETVIDSEDLSCKKISELWLPHYTGTFLKITLLIIITILAIWCYYKYYKQL